MPPSQEIRQRQNCTQCGRLSTPSGNTVPSQRGRFGTITDAPRCRQPRYGFKQGVGGIHAGDEQKRQRSENQCGEPAESDGCEAFADSGFSAVRMAFSRCKDSGQTDDDGGHGADGEFGDKRNGVVHSPSDRNADKHRGTDEGRQNGDQVENRRGVHGVTSGKEARCL